MPRKRLARRGNLWVDGGDLRGAEEAIELLAGRIEGALGLLVEVPGDQRTSVLVNLVENERAGIHGGRVRVFVADLNEMPAEHPEVIAVIIQRFAHISQCEQVLQERREHFDECLPGREVLVIETPGRGPVLQVRHVTRQRILVRGDNSDFFALAAWGRANHVADSLAQRLPPFSRFCL